MATTQQQVADLTDPTSEEAIAEAAAGILVGERVALGLAHSIARVGKTLTLTHPATSATADFIALVSTLGFHEMADRFTKTETDAWARPLYKLQVAGDFVTAWTGPVVGDTVALPDGSYTVRRVERLFIRTICQRTILYLARVV